MNKKADPREIAESLLDRSICAVQVAAVIVDKWGVYGWGWNNSGLSGFGEHAEAACLRRSNRRRWKGSAIYIAARRLRNGRVVTAKPCGRCLGLLAGTGIFVSYRDGNGQWW